MSVGANPQDWAGGAIAASQQRAARSRRLVLGAFKTLTGRVSIADVALKAGLSYFSARRALETLVAMHAVEASGPRNNQRFAVAGRGNVTGGPASESAGAAPGGVLLTDPARPGSAAA